MKPRISAVACRIAERLLRVSGMVGCASLVVPGAWAAGYPPPGDYRIDSDAVITFGAGSGGLEQRVQTDGATGTVTTTGKAPDGAVATSVVKGDKPVTWCVGPAGAAQVPRSSPFACETLGARAGATSSSFSTACASTSVDDTFRMIDPTTWEHVMTFQVRADRTPVRSAREAIAMASPGMTPAQRAEAQKALSELPPQAQIDSLQADMLRQAEDDVRTAESPQEADSARQVLNALRQRMSGTAVQRTIRVKERWTLLRPACSPGR